MVKSNGRGSPANSEGNLYFFLVFDIFQDFLYFAAQGGPRMKPQRQVDLGMGRGLQPGGLAVKDAPEASENTDSRNEAPVKRRQRSLTGEH